MLQGKYGSEILSNINASASLSKTKLSTMANCILQKAESSQEIAGDFKWTLRNGETIQFWNDKWKNGELMSSDFGRLYQLAKNKTISIKEMVVSWCNANESTQHFWRRNLRGWEITEARRLDAVISQINLIVGADILHWGEMKGSFSSSAYYDKILHHQGVQGPWKLIWKQKVPPRTKFFLWQLAHNILPTLSLLKRRDICTDDVCKWCGSETEDIDHLFGKCSLAQMAWKILSIWLEADLDFNQPFNIEYCFKSFSSNDFRIGGGICVTAVLWSIWLIRNECVFHKVKIQEDRLQLVIKHRAHTWSVQNRLISPNLENIWTHYPRQAFTLQRKWAVKVLLEYWFKATNLVGFVDGSLKKIGLGHTISGIGGYIINKQGSVLFIFSGPSQKTTCYDVEFEALNLLVDNFIQQNLRDRQLTVFTDSSNLVHNINQRKEVTDGDRLGDEDLYHKCYTNNINVININRDHNVEADRLAKEGAARLKLLSSWI